MLFRSRLAYWPPTPSSSEAELKYFFVGAVVTLVITRNVSWRRWFGSKPLTAKIAAIAFAVGWAAAVGALLFLV